MTVTEYRIFGFLTNKAARSATWLTRPSINVEICVATGAPLAQNPSSCVDDVDEIRVRIV